MANMYKYIDKGQIVAFNHCKWSGQEIADYLEVGKSTINDFLKKYRETGSYMRSQGSGRKRKISDSDSNYMLLSIKKNRHITLNELKRSLPENISKSISSFIQPTCDCLPNLSCKSFMVFSKFSHCNEKNDISSENILISRFTQLLNFFFELCTWFY